MIPEIVRNSGFFLSWAFAVWGWELRALTLQYGPHLAPAETKSLLLLKIAHNILPQQVSSPLYVFVFPLLVSSLRYSKHSILADVLIFSLFLCRSCLITLISLTLHRTRIYGHWYHAVGYMDNDKDNNEGGI
jgi:hypothetical protein